MSQQAIDILVLTVTADGTITEDRFVTAAGAPAAADDNTLGVARSEAADGDPVAVTALGTAVVEVGGAIAVGDPLSSDKDGKAVKTDGTTYTTTVARALEKATAAGDKIEAILIPN